MEAVLGPVGIAGQDRGALLVKADDGSENCVGGPVRLVGLKAHWVLADLQHLPSS